MSREAISSLTRTVHLGENSRKPFYSIDDKHSMENFNRPGHDVITDGNFNKAESLFFTHSVETSFSTQDLKILLKTSMLVNGPHAQLAKYL